MSHGETWEFYLLGKYLERGCQTARILDVKYHFLLPRLEHVGTPIDTAHWTAILKSCSAYEPFLKKRLLGDPGIGRGLPDLGPALPALGPVLPASAGSSVRRSRVVRWQAGQRGRACPRRPGRWLNLVKIDDFVRAGLHEELIRVINRIHEIGNAIHRTYFDVRVKAGGFSRLPPRLRPKPDSQRRRLQVRSGPMLSSRQHRERTRDSLRCR